MTYFADSSIEDTISKLAQDESGKRQYYRPVYSLHKWWARRPGALFRSIILLAARQGDTPLFSVTSDGTPLPNSDYFQSHNLQDITILDPFMGGGTTLVEANRMGAKVIGCDLNPVSFWVVQETLKPLDLDKLDAYFQQIGGTAGKKIGNLYRTHCPHCNASNPVMYTFWVRYVTCPFCGNEVHLFKRTLLNRGEQRNKLPSPSNPATVFCPQCLALNQWHGKGPCTCQQCGHTFDPRQGTYNQGRYTCPHCAHEHISLIQTLHSGQRLRERMVAIEYWCPQLKKRLYKSPDEEDLQNISRIERIVSERWEQLTFPKQEILPGDSSARWRKHNYRHYYEVFNARQLLAFNYLFAAFQEIPETAYRHAFITMFSNSLEYNNMMTPYNYPHRKLHHLFNYHAMPLTTTPVENSVWGVGTGGAGTFVNCYHRYRRAKAYCQRPFDKFKASDGTVQTISAESEHIAGHFVTTFTELQQTPRGALLLCGDSSRLPQIPDRSVDFVITDPPYLDSIHYSELSNFFYVWLQALIEHPYFTAEHVPTAQEAIVNRSMDKDEHDYHRLLSAVFTESDRVLKPNGALIFTFHHTKWRAWWTVLTALTESGFQVTDYFSAMSEYKVNPHIRNKQALDMDLVLICRPSTVAEQLSSAPEDILRRALARVQSGGNPHHTKLFLHFMGELLRTASRTLESMTYHQFVAALEHFDDYLLHLQRDVPPVTPEPLAFHQLALLEGQY